MFPKLKIRVSLNMHCSESTENIQNNIFYPKIVYINVAMYDSHLGMLWIKSGSRGAGCPKTLDSTPVIYERFLLSHCVQIDAGANLPNGYMDSFPRDKLVGAWSSALTSI
jgi:hypothetical protein